MNSIINIVCCRDIKQSLKMKKKEERSKALHIPEETKPETLLALAGYEVRARRHDLAFIFISKVAASAT